MSAENNPAFTRRKFIKTSAGTVAALGLSVALPGCGNSTKRTVSKEVPHSSHMTAYVPDWLDDQTYEKVANTLPKHSIDTPTIAFALPNSKGEIDAPKVSGACVKMLGALAASNEVALAIGGWGGSDQGHQTILSNWSRAANNPEVFSRSVVGVVHNLQASTGLEVAGLDIDWEYPEVADQDRLIGLAGVLKDALPAIKLTMAVPADHDLEGFRFGAGGLQKYVDTLRVMTYDKEGPWSKKAGDIAPGQWVIGCIDQWVQRVGDASKIEVGYPAYGYWFPEAKERGSSFEHTNKDQQILYRDIPEVSIKDSESDLTSEAIVDDAWVSCVSPTVIRLIHNEVKSRYPSIGGAFYWSIEGMVPGHIKAIK